MINYLLFKLCPSLFYRVLSEGRSFYQNDKTYHFDKKTCPNRVQRELTTPGLDISPPVNDSLWVFGLHLRKNAGR